VNDARSRAKVDATPDANLAVMADAVVAAVSAAKWPTATAVCPAKVDVAVKVAVKAAQMDEVRAAPNCVTAKSALRGANATSVHRATVAAKAVTTAKSMAAAMPHPN
jgi:hypothetical protein